MLWELNDLSRFFNCWGFFHHLCTLVAVKLVSVKPSTQSIRTASIKMRVLAPEPVFMKMIQVNLSFAHLHKVIYTKPILIKPGKGGAACLADLVDLEESINQCPLLPSQSYRHHACSNEKSLDWCLFPIHTGMIRKPSKEQNAPLSSLFFAVLEKLPAWQQPYLILPFRWHFWTCAEEHGAVSALLRAERLSSNLAGAQLLP